MKEENMKEENDDRIYIVLTDYYDKPHRINADNISIDPETKVLEFTIDRGRVVIAQFQTWQWWKLVPLKEFEAQEDSKT